VAPFDTADCVAVATSDVLLVSVGVAVDVGSGVAVAVGPAVGSGFAVPIGGEVTVGVAVLESNGSATLLEVVVPPGAVSFHLKSELWG
jgi:hypothetical protein